MPKALFFDIDGTLVDSYHGITTVPPSVLRELVRLQAQGHRLFISSGRPLPMLTPEIAQLGFDGFVLANGGQVEIAGKSVYEERMGEQTARTVAQLLDELGFEYALDSANHVFTRRSNAGMQEFFSEYPNLFTFDYDPEEAYKKTIKIEIVPPETERDDLVRRVTERLGDSVICDNNGTGMTVEIYSTHLSKAEGIRKALEHFDIAQRDSYGFGDGANDLSMIRFCAVGVAMGNAVPELKAQADLVCAPIWEDGLARVLRELFPAA